MKSVNVLTELFNVEASVAVQSVRTGCRINPDNGVMAIQRDILR